MIKEVQSCVDQYDHVFVFSFENMRTAYFTELRAKFKSDSRFFMGKHKVMRMALGSAKRDEYQPALHQLSQHLSGTYTG